MKFKSIAVWPDGTTLTFSDITRDTHDTFSQAQSVCDTLKEKGFGCDGKVFPLDVYVESFPEEHEIDEEFQ